MINCCHPFQHRPLRRNQIRESDTYHLTINNDDPEPTNPAILPDHSSVDDCQSDGNDSSSDDCQKRIDYIIGPSKDGFNQPIRDALASMPLRKPYAVSESPKHGMVFCLAGLTKNEAKRLKSRQRRYFRRS